MTQTQWLFNFQESCWTPVVNYGQGNTITTPNSRVPVLSLPITQKFCSLYNDQDLSAFSLNDQFALIYPGNWWNLHENKLPWNGVCISKKLSKYWQRGKLTTQVTRSRCKLITLTTRSSSFARSSKSAQCSKQTVFQCTQLHLAKRAPYKLYNVYTRGLIGQRIYGRTYEMTQNNQKEMRIIEIVISSQWKYTEWNYFTI